MGYVDCEKHGDSFGFMVSRKIADAIRNRSRKIRKSDLHLVQIKLADEGPVDFAYWIEQDELREMGMELKDVYPFWAEGEKIIGKSVPVCKQCFHEILE